MESDKVKKECFCCKKVKEGGTIIEDRYVCNSCNHIGEKNDK